MTRPLRSTPITGASPLLRAGPPAHPATRAGPRAASSNPQLAVSGRAFSRSVRERQIRLTSPPCRTPPGQSAGTRQAPPGARSITPVLMPSVFVTTRRQRFACARLPDPHLTPRGRLFLDRSPRRSSANAARGGLKPPPAGRLRRANPSSPEQHHQPRIPPTAQGPPSMFVTHGSAKLHDLE